jgi:YD repeat-containing protein
MRIRPVAALFYLVTVSTACEPIEDPEDRVVWEPSYDRAASAPVSSGQPQVDLSCGDDVKIWNFTRDDEGRVVQTQVFTANQEDPLRTEGYEYDVHGLSKFETSTANGAYSLTILRDDEGRVIERRYHSEQAERDTVERVVMETDALRIVEIEGRLDWLFWRPIFSNLNYVPNSEVDRHLVAIELIQSGTDDVSQLDFDGHTNIAEGFIDHEITSYIIHIRQTFEFDEQGREVLVESEDLSGDQAPARRVTVFTDVEGNTRSERTLDFNGDQVAEQTLIEVRDGDGTLLSQTWEVEAESEPMNRRTEWTYDDQGRVQVETHVNGDQRTVATHSYIENVWTIERESDESGRASRRTEVYLNDNGNRVLKREIDDRDEPPYYQKRYAYDEESRRVYDERDSNMNGQYNERWDYFYGMGQMPVWEVRIKPQMTRCE